MSIVNLKVSKIWSYHRKTSKFGGSKGRTEATGFGVAVIAREAAKIWNRYYKIQGGYTGFWKCG